MRRVHLIISGDVQGVGFRAWLKRHAREQGITGWVRNRGDDTVEAEIQASSDKLTEFLKICKTGPETGRVETVKQAELPIDAGLGSFEIKSSV